MASLRDLFEIRAGEWRRFVLLYVFVFAVTVAVIWGGAVSDSLFLTLVGAEFLPFLFIINAFLTITAIIIYGAFVDRLSNMFLMVAIALFGAVGVVLARFGLEIPDFRPVFWILYLLSRVLKDVISIHAWTYIADFYDTRTAKRHYPLLGSASRTAGILGGALIGLITALFQAEGLVLAWAGALVFSALMAVSIPRFVGLVTEADEKQSEPSGPLQNMSEGFGYVASSGFLRFMAGAALMGWILLKLLEFETQTILAGAFTSTEQLATLLGTLQVVGNIITLPIQMFFLSRLVNRIGVGNANLIFPGLSALAYGLVVAFGSVPAALFGYIDYESLRSAFRTPIDNLMYNAVPAEVKGRTRAFINGLIVPGSLLIAGLLLLVATRGLIPTQVLIWLGIATAVAYVGTALGARAQYGRSLATLLSDGELSLFRMGGDALDQADPAALRLLHWRLEESEDDDMTVFLLEILHDFEGYEAVPRLLRLATTRSPTVRAGATQILSEWITDSEVRELCLEGLDHEDPRVRRAAAAALAEDPEAQSDEGLLDAFLEMLEDPDQTVREKIIPPLIGSGDFFYLAPAVEALNDWLRDDTDVQNRALGLRVLTQTGSERLLRTLVRYLGDPSPLVRRQAVELIDELAAQTPLAEVKELGLRTLHRLLSDDDESVRIAAVHSLGRFGSLASSRTLIAALSDESFDVRCNACAAMRPIPKRELERALDARDIYLVESAAYILARDNHSRARRLAIELMESLVRNAYRLYAHSHVLEPLDTPGMGLLRDTLTEQADQFVSRAFWLLGSLSDEEEAEAVRHSLQSENSALRANAAETLEALTTPLLARVIAPLYEDMPFADIVRRGCETLELDMPTESQVFQTAWPQLEINANPWDLADLPLPQRQVMRLMLRETQMTDEELSQAVKALPSDRRFDDTALRSALQSLVEGQWLVSLREGQTTRYVINLHQKRGGAFAQDIWATLTDRNLSAFYTGDGWVTAVTIFALVEMNAKGEGNGGPPSVPTDVLERALQATLQADDVPSIVEESARFGLDQLRGNGR